jgi:hypothetical protein
VTPFSIDGRRLLLVAAALVSIGGCSDKAAPERDRTINGVTKAHLDQVGVYNPLTGTFFLKLKGNEVLPVGFGKPEQIPLIGDWDGDGIDTIGVYSPLTGTFFLNTANRNGDAPKQLAFGTPNRVPIVGDWHADGKDSIGIYDPLTGTFFLCARLTPGANDERFSFGPPNLVPLTGHWQP